jgi:hypothetical protein
VYLSGETGNLRPIQGLTAKAYRKLTNAIEGRSQYAQRMGVGMWKGQPPVRAGRYQVESQTQGSDIWEPICYAADLSKAERYAGAMLRSGETQAARVVDQKTGQVWIIKPEGRDPADSAL